MLLQILRLLNVCGSVCLFVMTAGCLNPGMYYGNPYAQPMYAPPQMLNQGVPGQLVIPESNNAPYDPGGSTYDSDPDDDFRRSDGDDDSRFFQPDDGAPLPRDPGRSPFDSDLGGPSTFIEPGNGGIQPVSHTQMPTEYGFDTANYSWLRGMLHFIPEQKVWVVEYSLAANDRFRGSLILNATAQQLRGFRDGDAVDVHGRVSPDLHQTGSAVYQVDMIRSLSAEFAR